MMNTTDYMRLRRSLKAPRPMTNDSCPHCGEDLDLLGLDVLTDFDEGECSLDWQACCEGMLADVEAYGFEGVHGVRVEACVEQLTGLEVLTISEHSDVVGRLNIHDRTEVAGEGSYTAPAGWQKRVFDAVVTHHQHHKKRPTGYKFGVEIYNGAVRVGVAVCSRPVSRLLATSNPGTLEVTRVAVWGASALRKNAVSKLYSACADTARRGGYDTLITYTLESESGHSLIAAGWVPVARSAGGSWSRSERERQDAAPTCPKIRWAKGLTKNTRRAIEAGPRIELSKPDDSEA